MTASLPDFKHGVFFLSWRSRIACPLPRQRYRVAKQNVCPCFEHLRESDVGRIRLVLGPAAPQPPRSDVLCSESSSGERAPPASKSGGSRIGALASCAAAGLGGPQAAQPRFVRCFGQRVGGKSHPVGFVRTRGNGCVSRKLGWRRGAVHFVVLNRHFVLICRLSSLSLSLWHACFLF